MRRLRWPAIVVNVALVLSVSAGSFSMCLEDGSDAMRAMACCKAHDGCEDAMTARDCCRHERAKESVVTQSPAVKTLPAAVAPPPVIAFATAIGLQWRSVARATAGIAAVAESPPLFLTHHSFRI
jgi:hypothetical protein